jgi:hypothetical protein
MFSALRVSTSKSVDLIMDHDAPPALMKLLIPENTTGFGRPVSISREYEVCICG